MAYTGDAFSISTANLHGKFTLTASVKRMFIEIAEKLYKLNEKLDDNIPYMTKEEFIKLRVNGWMDKL